MAVASLASRRYANLYRPGRGGACTSSHTHAGSSSCAALPWEGVYERGTELTYLGVTKGQANKVRVHTIIAGRLGHIPAPQSAHDTMQQGCCECLTLRHQAPPASYSSQPTVDSVAGRSPSRHRTTLSCLLTKTNTPQARSHCTHTELYRNAGAKRAAVAHTCPHTHTHHVRGTAWACGDVHLHRFTPKHVTVIFATLVTTIIHGQAHDGHGGGGGRVGGVVGRSRCKHKRTRSTLRVKVPHRWRRHDEWCAGRVEAVPH